MIDFDNIINRMEMECDECGSNIHFDGNWHECINQAKEDNWFIKNEDGEWRHICSDCSDLGL